MVRLTLRLPDDVFAAVQTIAAADERPMNTTMIRLMRFGIEYLAQMPPGTLEEGLAMAASSKNGKAREGNHPSRAGRA